MRIFRGLDHLPPFRRSVATVGSYDGVHCGHRALLRQVTDRAEACGGESIVFTFDPHPRLLLEKEPGLRLLTSLEEKCFLLEKAGIDNLVVIPFDRAFSLTAPRDFIRILTEKANVSTLVVGYDHRFGRDKEGGHELLQRLGTEYGVQIVEIAEQELEHEHLSSTVIRRLIERGETAHASRLLGYGYLLAAETGREGRLVLHDSCKLLPGTGEYAVRFMTPAELAGREALLCITPDGLYLKTREILPSGQQFLLSF